jgi:hypothetical protein
MTQYQSGNTWSGEIYQDDVGTGTPDAMALVRFAAIDNQSTFFQPMKCGSTPSPFQGIIGFAPQPSAVTGTDGYFDDLVGSGFMPNIFATQLCETGGTLWLGGYDPTAVSAPVQYVPMSTSFFAQFSYLVRLAQIVVDGTSVTVPTGGYMDSLLDTGTSEFILNTATFDAITAVLTTDPAFQTNVSMNPSWFGNPNNCLSLTMTKAELDAALPPMTLIYGTGPTVSIQAVATESYLLSYAGEWCPALASYPASGSFPFAAVVGSPVLKSSVTVFDRAGSRVGFAPHAPCP